jgi:hypothetical protein
MGDRLQARMTNTVPGSLLKPKAHEKLLKTVCVGEYFGEQAFNG